MSYTCNLYCTSTIPQLEKKKDVIKDQHVWEEKGGRRSGQRGGDLDAGLMMKAWPVPIRVSHMDPHGWVFMSPACSVPGCSLPPGRAWSRAGRVSAAETSWRRWQLETIWPLTPLLATGEVGGHLCVHQHSFQHLYISWILQPSWSASRAEVLTQLYRWANWGRTLSEIVLSRSSKPGLQSPPPVPLWPRTRTQWK